MTQQRWSSMSTGSSVDGPRISRNGSLKGAIQSYRSFVRQGRGLEVWDKLRSGSLLGSDVFVERIRPLLQSAPLDPNILRKELDAARPSLDDLFTDVRNKATRDSHIHEAVRRYHYTLQAVGDYLGLHYSTISVIASREGLRIQE